jgi:predicted aspartyl protease
LEGAIDQLNRPYVRVDVAGFSDSIIAFIDTGFNGALIVDEAQARRMDLGVQRDQRADVRLASQKEESFYLGRGTLAWFDEAKEITAYVLIESEEQRSERLKGKENEEVLIGTELLLDCRLEIDFVLRKSLIAKADT